MIKIVLQILLISLPVLCFAQSSKKIVLGITKKLPVQNAKAYYIEDYGTHLYSSSGGLSFEPSDDSVFSVSSSIVCTVFDLGNGQTVVTKDSLDRFYTYINLREVSFAKGDKINKGSLIGLMIDTSKTFGSFLFMITNNKGVSFNAERVWELLEEFNQSYCEDDKIAFQPNQNNHINPVQTISER